MARAEGVLNNSQPIATGTVAKTLYQYTAPAGGGGAAVLPRSIDFDGTNAASGKTLVEVVRGATGGTGSAVTVRAKKANNPSGADLGTAKENFTVEPSGGTVIGRWNMAPYGSFPIPLGEVVLAPGETLGIRTTGLVGTNALVNGTVET